MSANVKDQQLEPGSSPSSLVSSPSTTIIYVSFGSWLSAEHLPGAVQTIFEKVIQRLVNSRGDLGEGIAGDVKVIFKRGKTEAEMEDGEISVLERMNNVFVKKW